LVAVLVAFAAGAVLEGTGSWPRVGGGDHERYASPRKRIVKTPKFASFLTMA
jgi:hypothetical protein